MMKLQFKEIDIEAKKELDKYFGLVDYEACEYCFNTLFMWQQTYKTSYHIGDGFAVLVGEHEGKVFSILPLAPKEKLEEAIKYVVDWFDNNDEHKLYFRGIDNNVVEMLQRMYPDRFEYRAERDIFDYVYDAQKLRELKGRKLSAKRNHLNYFKREYEARVEKRLLTAEDFPACFELLGVWNDAKNGDVDYENSIDDEFKGMKKLFDNFDRIKDKLKIYGIFIDGRLEAFSMGEMITDEMALIHIEKANPDIRGLYPYINQMFITEVFSEAKWVNREEDMGLDGLRKAKLSYQPDRFVEKYEVVEK